MAGTKVVNKKECNYTFVSLIGKQMWGMRADKLKSEPLAVASVHIVENSSEIKEDYTRMDMVRSIGGLLLFGLPGAVVSHHSAKGGDKWDVKAIISLSDGRQVAIHTSERKYVQWLVDMELGEQKTERWW